MRTLYYNSQCVLFRTSATSEVDTPTYDVIGDMHLYDVVQMKEQPTAVVGSKVEEFVTSQM